MFYEMIALYAGKVSNYFRHYANLVHFLTQLNKNNYFKGLNLFLSSKIITTVINFDYNLKFHLQFILTMAEKRPAKVSIQRVF